MIMKKVSSKMLGENSIIFMKELEYLLQSSVYSIGNSFKSHK